MIISQPMAPSLYSVRMRASLHGQHLAGAERIVDEAAVIEASSALVARAMDASHSPADEIHCRVERIETTEVVYQRLPDVSTYQVDDWQQGRLAAAWLLANAGIQKDIATRAVELLADGAGPDGAVMRGAVLMDAKTGARLEGDPSRGVRVSRMDLVPENRQFIEQLMLSKELGHHRILEALVLAGKVLSAPGIVAELCWSDDPSYITGYVADSQNGYQRISELKQTGDMSGGRVFFVDLSKTSIAELVEYLEGRVILFNACGMISPPEKWLSDDE